MIINFDYINIAILISCFTILILGLLIILQKRDKVGWGFFALTLSIFFWSISMTFFRSGNPIDITIIIARFLYFFPFFIPITFLYLASTFPQNTHFYSKKTWILSALLIITSILIIFIPGGLILNIIPIENQEPKIVFNQIANFWYMAMIVFFFALAYYALIKKYFKNENKITKKHIIHIVLWTFIAAFVGMITNVFLPTFNIFSLNWFGQLSTLIMISGIYYAIIKHHLFNIKVVVTEFFLFSLWILLLIRVLLSSNQNELVFNLALLIATIVVGIFLIRSVIKEVEQREKIERLAKELAATNSSLEVANAKLEELNQQKTEFVSIASHQLRSPLTAIKGYSSMILEGSYGKINGKTKEAIERIFESSQRLVNIIEDFLNITRIELGKMKYEMDEFDLTKMVNDLINEFTPNANRKKIKLEFSPVGKVLAYGDLGKINQVISNMIDNAIKYTNEGSIKINIKKEKGKIAVAVQDTGVGLSGEDIEKMFQKFVRAEGAGQVNISGTGLGMFVAKQIAEAHGGTIRAESKGRGQGSTFIMELPDKIGQKRKEDIETFAGDL